MMETYKTSSALFFYNSDFSEEVIIAGFDEDGNATSVVINAKNILSFVADCYVKPAKISEIEDSGYQQLLQGGLNDD